MTHRIWPLIFVIIASCAAPPPVRPPALRAEIPAQRRSGASVAEGSSVSWWKLLGSEVLDSLVAEGLEHNPSLDGAAARIEAAAARARIAGAGGWPQLGAGGTGSRSKRSFVGFPSFGPPGTGGDGPVSVESTTYGVSLDLSWEIDLWGRIRSGQSAALADAQMAEALWQGARSSIAGQICKAYFGLAEAEQQMELAEATSANRAELLERIEARYARGLRSSLDVHRARAELESSKARLALRRAQRDSAGRQLEILLGRYPSASIAARALPSPPEGLPTGLPADLIDRRPELEAAERAVAAADRRTAEARRALYPRVMLTGSSGTTSDELGDLSDGDFAVWSIGASISQPLFQGGRIIAGIDAADAGLREAYASFTATALRAYAEVESALDAEARLEEQVRALRNAVEASSQALRLAEARYTGGLADVLMLLDAQRSDYDARSSLIEASRQRLDNRVNLHLSLGGGFHRDDETRTSS